MSLWNTVNKVCSQLPKGFQINLCMENGSAWVQAYDDQDNEINLPDSTDKQLQEELNDALTESINIYKEILT